ncbi:hypothetical protein [Nocardioides ganghwensis]|uniref:Uncharacterized protein n=1 Tax=Nocardioides ganghwensis TaxID=252230 RepID=A0A4Q2SLH0_9ACTN|nr:hypothetical protein [Nocardioides ganghwensis]MBD3945067.1 hypothetical protein [Nocardioides ganghwensis]RYC04944.1 hypothetical protein EUA07_00095 [Nocardioides ganghwensis]
MSKMDNLRAMREAKYAAAQKRAADAPARPQAPVAPVAPPAPKRVEERAADAAGDLCGHRNMSGRTCTRERGHAAKSHRYS